MIHWQHHPARLQRWEIKGIYNKFLEPMKIDVSWPRNLSDIPTHTALTLPERINLNELIATYNSVNTT
jgi:hypothetical protein